MVNITEFVFIQWVFILILVLAMSIVLTRFRYGRGRYPYAPFVLIYLLTAIAVLLGILIFLVVTFFTEPYVTHEALSATFGSLVALILGAVFYLNHRIDSLHTRIDSLRSLRRRR